MNYKQVDHLLVSSSLDFTTDYVALELKKRGESFIRINRDQFREYNIFYSFKDEALFISSDELYYRLDKGKLKSIYFRAPTFIRSHRNYGVEEQLYRSQWSSFLRNLIVFENIRWINNPVSTYKAENKLYQLDKAQEAGFIIPKTIIGNYWGDEFTKTGLGSKGFHRKSSDNSRFIVKSLDTALFYTENEEWFTYSTIMTSEEMKSASLNDAPVIIQECLENKTDIRVTIVGDRIFPASITKENKGIDGDWRKIQKEFLQYNPISLPSDVKNSIRNLMSSLKLTFGGMDLALMDGKYYFIEVNPTGEWAWLVNTAGFNIPEAIVDYMVKSE